MSFRVKQNGNSVLCTLLFNIMILNSSLFLDLLEVYRWGYSIFSRLDKIIQLMSSRYSELLPFFSTNIHSAAKKLLFLVIDLALREIERGERGGKG